MNNTILITGASGLIGTALTELLLLHGYIVRHLSRSGKQINPKVKVFKWDVSTRMIDENCIQGVDVIIHLAGEGIANKIWTKKRKEQIIKSRIDSIAMIYDLLKKNKNEVKTIVSSSGINYYQGDHIKLLSEGNPAGKNFLSQVCIKWEEAADKGKELDLRVVKLRTGIVLDKDGGALPKIAFPVKYGLGAALGSGKQWVSWIHLEDAIRIYLFAFENDLEGAYNMVAPQPATNEELTKAIAAQLNKPFWFPNIPAFVLKIALGEMSSTVLESVKASADKITSQGFQFHFPTLQSALKDIYPQE